MKPPLFWYQDDSFWARLLSPLGAIYAMGTARRLREGPHTEATVPVICVGNINAGGTGKTPTVVAIVQRLLAAGATPHIVSRGYGGRLTGPILVDSAQHLAADVGDEPLMMSSFAPVWVAKDRAAGVRAAEQGGACVIVLDDGFQSPSVKKDLQIVVVDAIKGFGNGRVMPAGPLREPANVGLARADAVLVIGTKEARSSFSLDLPDGCLRLEAQIDPLPTGMPWANLPVLAFAGIGHPEKFFATLKSLGAAVERTEAFDDHQPFTDTILARLEAEAKKLRLQLVTTEKDAVRLPAYFRPKVMVLPVRLSVIDEAPLNDLLLDAGAISK